MGKVLKQSILTSIYSYIGVLIGFFNTLFLIPYVLQPSDLGLFRVVQDLAILLTPFAQIGLGHGMQKFFPLFSASKHHRQQLLSFMLLASLLGFLAFGLLFFLTKPLILDFFTPNAPQVTQYLNVVLVVTLLMVLNSILDAYARSLLKVAFPAFIREVLIRLFTALLVTAYFLGYLEISGLIYGFILVYASGLLIMWLYLLREKEFALTLKLDLIDKKLVSQIVNYCLITLAATAGSVLVMKIDTVMVTGLMGQEATAIYTTAFFIAVVIEMPRRAVSQTILPILSKELSEQNISEVGRIYKRVATSQYLVCLLIFIGIWANIETLYTLIPKSDIYVKGLWVVFIIGLAKLIDVISSVNGEIIVMSKFYRFNIIATAIMAVATIGFNYLLIPLYGLEGAALASFLAILLYNLVKFIYIKSVLKISPWDKQLLFITLLGAISYAVGYFMPKLNNGVLDILLRSLVITLTYIGLFRWTKWSDDFMIIWKKGFEMIYKIK